MTRSLPFAALLALALAACGGDPPATADAGTPADASAPADAATAARDPGGKGPAAPRGGDAPAGDLPDAVDGDAGPRAIAGQDGGGRDVDDPRLQARLDAILEGGDPAAGVPMSQASEDEVRRTGEALAGLVGGSGRPAAEAGAMDAATALQVVAELGRPGMALDEQQRARLQAAQDTLYGSKGSDRRLRNEDEVRRQLGLEAVAGKKKAEWLARQPADWKLHRHQARGGEADLVVRTGDIDNLGFGWPVDFDPFSGASTPPHAYPWTPDEADPPGTDRIQVISGHRGGGGRTDGYTERTRRPDNLPRPIRLDFDLAGITPREVRLQLFVDDFQAPSFGNHYRVWLDGREAPLMAEALNTLRQRGPVGKLVTLQLLPEQFDLLADGALEIRIDDPDTDAGDGFAIDFARLLVNPGESRQTATITGRILDKRTREPIAGALASAAGTAESRSGADGAYRLEGVPAGLAVITASHPDYAAASASVDLEAGDEGRLDLRLEPRDEGERALERALEDSGQVDLYGVYFDTAEATLKPESEQTLGQVLALLKRKPALRLQVAGHTDAQGEAGYNQALSRRRAETVVAWLVARGIPADRLAAEGHGESRPVASNASEEGRARNRRVELRQLR